MTINLSMPATHQLKPRITVVGVGGAGGNAVNNMITSHLEGVEFVVANTDAQALAQSLSERRTQLGVSITQGLGAGSRPDIGRAAAEETIDEIVEHLTGSNMVFITAGLGGGTGTGAAPVIAQVAREQGILTVAVVTKPFQFEGIHRMQIAEEGLAELQQYVDTLIIIPNQNLFRVANDKTTFADAFKMADDVLSSGVRGVTDLMVMPGLINLDFADVRTVMAEMGKAMMGTGEAEGEQRAVDAAESAISNPLLDEISMQGAKGVLINITGGYDMTLFEVDAAANRIREEVDPEANIIFGSTFDDSLAGRMRVSVVATGITANGESIVRPVTVEASRRDDPAPQYLEPTAENLEPTAENFEPAAETADEPVAAEGGEPEADDQTADAPAATASDPEDSFIPPPPVDPGPRWPFSARPEPFAEAAMQNGSVAAPRAKLEPRRGPTLFERVTGTGRARDGRPKLQREPVLGSVRDRVPAPVPSAPEPSAAMPSAPAPATPKPASAAPKPAPPAPVLEPVLETAGAESQSSSVEEPKPQRPEDDLLDIPAFLRRQTN
jgi:cell division protein FtsZ